MSVSRRGIAAVVATTLLASAISIGAVVVRITSPSTGTVIPSSGFPANGVLVQTVPGASEAVRDGDLVTSIAGRPVTAWAETWLAADDDLRPAAGETVAFEIERYGARLALDVPLGPYPASAVLVPAVGTLTFVLAMLLVGAVVFTLRPRVPASGALLLAGVGAAGSTAPFLLGQDPLDLATGSYAVGLAATSAVYLLLWAGLLDFFLVFPRPFGVVARRPVLRAILYVTLFATYGSVLALSRVAAPTTLAWLGGWAPISLLPAVLTFVLGPAILAVRWRRAAAGDRRILRGFAVVMAFIVAANAVVWVIPEALTGSPLIPWSIAAVIGLPFPLLVAASIVRHRAFDIDVVVRRSLVYGGLTLAVVATYAVTAGILGTALGGNGGFASSLVATGVAAVAVLPLRDALQRGATRFVYGDRDEPVQAIRRLGDRLALVADPARLPVVVVDAVARALRLPYVALELESGSPTTRAFAERGTRPPPETVVARPLVARGRVLGRLLVAPRGPGDPLSAADLRLLDDLCRQVAAAADAATLTDDLRASRERIVSGREEERRRLRRDLHDGLGPALAAIGMRAEAAETVLADDPRTAARLLGELREESTQALAEIRRLVDGLRPPAIDEVGLVGALRLAADRLATVDGPTVVVPADEPLPALPAAVEVAAYRIATEALTNAIRHAGARTVSVRLAAGPALTITVDDDGVGYAGPRAGGVGLASMHERAAELGGSLEIGPGPRGGTRVRAELPLAPVGPAQEGGAS